MDLWNNTCISAGEYRELAGYAGRKGVRLSGFKKYCGDIHVIMEAVDDISEIAVDFPEILRGRRSIELSLDFYSGGDIFATTVRHVIYLNASLYMDAVQLKAEYDLAVAQKKFAAGTDWRSIIRHETGHVVANIYHIQPLEIAGRILGTGSVIRILQYVREHLSLYSAEYPDGREIISECFSAHYSRAGNKFATAFVHACMRGGDSDEKEQRTFILDDK